MKDVFVFVPYSVLRNFLYASNTLIKGSPSFEALNIKRQNNLN